MVLSWNFKVKELLLIVCELSLRTSMDRQLSSLEVSAPLK